MFYHFFYSDTIVNIDSIFDLYIFQTNSLKRHFCDLSMQVENGKKKVTKKAITSSPKQTFYCHVSGKTFIKLTHLFLHLRIHSGERLYKCNMCETAFYQSCHLKCNIRTHTGERPYPCTLCEKAFSGSRKLK